MDAGGGVIRRVLVVDDSRLQRRILSASLQRWGFEVQEAESGDDALVLCRDDPPDLVMSDWMMPGLSGLVSFAHGETEDDDKFPDQDELDLTIDYRAPWLEDLWLRVRGGWRDRDGDLTEDYRVILNYEKTF